MDDKLALDPRLVFWAFFEDRGPSFKTAQAVAPVFSCVEDAVEWSAANLEKFHTLVLYETRTESLGAVYPHAAFARDIERKTQRDVPIFKDMMAKASAPAPIELAQTWVFGAKTTWRKSPEDVVRRVQQFLEMRMARS